MNTTILNSELEVIFFSGLYAINYCTIILATNVRREMYRMALIQDSNSNLHDEFLRALSSSYLFLLFTH